MLGVVAVQALEAVALAIQVVVLMSWGLDKDRRGQRRPGHHHEQWMLLLEQPLRFSEGWSSQAATGKRRLGSAAKNVGQHGYDRMGDGLGW